MTKKKVLLVVATELCIAGVPGVVMEIVRELHTDYHFDVVTFSEKEGYFDKEFESYGGKIHKFSVIEYKGWKRLLYPYRFIQIRRNMREILKTDRYDIIHSHAGCDDGVCHAEAKRAGIKIRISHAHGNYSIKRKNKIMQYANEIAKLQLKKNVTAPLACSTVAGDTLYKKMPYHNLLNPVNVSYYANIPKVAHEGVNFVQIGYFCRRKNQMFSIELINSLKINGIDAKLSFIGYPSEKDYAESLQEMVKTLSLGDRIEFLPPDVDKVNVLDKADYMLLPSESEGLPLVALESQAAKIVCLMSENIARDADMGAARFLPHNDVEAWTRAVMENTSINYNELEKKIAEVSCEAFAKKIEAFYR